MFNLLANVFVDERVRGKIVLFILPLVVTFRSTYKFEFLFNSQKQWTGCVLTHFFIKATRTSTKRILFWVQERR